MQPSLVRTHPFSRHLQLEHPRDRAKSSFPPANPRIQLAGIGNPPNQTPALNDLQAAARDAAHLLITCRNSRATSTLPSLAASILILLSSVLSLPARVAAKLETSAERHRSPAQSEHPRVFPGRRSRSIETLPPLNPAEPQFILPAWQPTTGCHGQLPIS